MDDGHPLTRPGFRRAVFPRGYRPRALTRYAVKLVLLPLVRARRRRLAATTTFVGVTGSAGKTTAKELLAVLLATTGPVKGSLKGGNRARKVARTVLLTRGRHRFCVQELAAFAPRTLDELLWAFEPDVGLVTNAGWDHYKDLRGPDGAAAEKVKLVEWIPPDGLVVLNWDDAHVRRMADRSKARVVSYGLDAAADYRAEEIRADWPRRLSFVLVHDGSRHEVQTTLVGEHWVTAVLGALATAIALGVPAETAVAAAARFEPTPHRLSVLEVPDGPTFLLDDWKAPVWTVAPALDALPSASGRRRVAVIGQLSDDPRKPRRLYADVARQARERADLVVLVGRWAHHGLAARQDEHDGSVQAFETVREAATYLGQELEPTDLVLLKGTHGKDHFERVSLAQAVQVECWRTVCGKKIFCEECRRLTRDPRPEISGWSQT